jgi:hypothetical protein
MKTDQSYDEIESEVRKLAYSLPPSDFGSTRAIHAVSNFVLQKLEAASPKRSPSWPEWSVSPGHCEHAENYEILERVRVCGWKTGLCAGPCPSCPNIDDAA